MHILLAGNGLMAHAIRDACAASGVSIEGFKSDLDLAGWSHESAVAIHAGSGREFDGLLAVCEKHCIPLIHASTEEVTLPTRQLKTVVVMAPNLSEPMAAFMALVSRLRAALPEFRFDSSEPEKGKKRFPEEHLCACADSGIKITLQAKVESWETHAKGALVIAERAHQIRGYPPGLYVVREGCTLLRAPCRV